MKLKNLLRYPLAIARASKKLRDRKIDRDTFDQPPIVLDLYTPDLLVDCGRHFASLAHYAAANHSSLVIRCSRLLLSAIEHKPFGGQMLEMPNVVWINTDESLPGDCLLLTDVSSENATRSRDGQRVVEMLIGKTIVSDVPVMPYPMHPGVLPYATTTALADARQTKNAKGIFFAGSQRAKYGRDVLRRGFGVLNRLEILETIREYFEHRIVTDRDDSDDSMPIVLPTNDRDKATPAVSIDQWLPTLAKHQFFLCCPGIAQPMCHNIIEAISVGVIPVIEYPHRLHPMLDDGVNAITYHGSDGLCDAINRIDALSKTELQTMRQNVINYYDQHLDSTAFIGRLRQQSGNDQSRQICLPFHDEDLTAMRSRLRRQPLAA